VAGSDVRTALIIGSSPNGEFILSALERAGLEVDASESPFEALLRFDERPTDLVLLFLDSLDDEDLEILPALREVDAGVRMLVAFGPSHRDRAAAALRLGADAYLPDPFYVSELLALARAARPAPAEPEAGSREVEELAGGVAHNINNPLTIVSGWVEILLGEIPEGDRRRRHLQSVLDETRRIRGVVDNLQAYARQRPLALERLDPGELVRTFFDEERRFSRLADVEVDLEVAPDLPEVRADRDALRGVLRHLTRNALRATSGRGRIRVATAHEAGRVVLVFADDGPGVPEDHRARIFRPFFSGFAGENCAGLGLSACEGILRAHGGTIRLVPDAPSGATFRIELPAAPGLPAEGRKD